MHLLDDRDFGSLISCEEFLLRTDAVSCDKEHIHENMPGHLVMNCLDDVAWKIC